MKSLLQPCWNTWKSYAREKWYYYRLVRALRRNRKWNPGDTIYPTIMQVQTVNRCNGHCLMCPYPETVGQEAPAIMPEELFEKIINEAAAWQRGGIFVLNFQNEPFLDKRMPSFLKKAHDSLGPAWQIEITTNGSLLNESLIRKLSEMPPQVLNLSLNAFDNQTYERVMPGMDWEQIQSNINSLMLAGQGRMKLFLRYIIQTDNAGEYPRFRKYWHKQGVPVFGFPLNDRLGSVKEYNDLREPVSSGLRQNIRRFLGRRIFPVCPLPFSQVNITAQGQVIICCNDYKHTGMAGDASSDKIVDVFNSEEYCEAREEVSGGTGHVTVCDECRFVRNDQWI